MKCFAELIHHLDDFQTAASRWTHLIIHFWRSLYYHLFKDEEERKEKVKKILSVKWGFAETRPLPHDLRWSTVRLFVPGHATRFCYCMSLISALNVPVQMSWILFHPKESSHRFHHHDHCSFDFITAVIYKGKHCRGCETEEWIIQSIHILKPTWYHPRSNLGT